MFITYCLLIENISGAGNVFSSVPLIISVVNARCFGSKADRTRLRILFEELLKGIRVKVE